MDTDLIKVDNTHAFINFTVLPERFWVIFVYWYTEEKALIHHYSLRSLENKVYISELFLTRNI